MTVTLSDVAREAGVSLATASRAINGSASRTVGTELRERVLATAVRLRYTPDANAQAMARGRTTSLGLLVHDIADPYFSTIAAGVAEAADAHGLQMTLASSQHDSGREVDLVHLLRRQRARAIIVAGGRSNDVEINDQLRLALADYRATGGSAALIGQPILGVNTIVVNNAQGATSLARAVHDRGYRRFAILGGPEQHFSARERREAFIFALGERGTEVADDAVVFSPFTHAGGEDGMRTLMSRGQLPEMIFAVADVMALGAMAVMREAGIRVPHDVAIAGFGDIPTLRDVTPALTTVRVPLHQLGLMATQLALAEPSEEPEIRAVVTEVVVRDTTPHLR
ncbi:LacI family DNA-binding transcriptional regulator [Cellulomonas sp. URHD0024]|uniref:LacI family DNA-binding transcriptional regulator n=1 Tax=Cellulomonas sp. URHD0024 TaxID=1302620 RepID=UPI0005555033|nr:LacI family DNA-binding transcriptional regulator [Cellulomonas sp. URHD0024]